MRSALAVISLALAFCAVNSAAHGQAISNSTGQCSECKGTYPYEVCQPVTGTTEGHTICWIDGNNMCEIGGSKCNSQPAILRANVVGADGSFTVTSVRPITMIVDAPPLASIARLTSRQAVQSMLIDNRTFEVNCAGIVTRRTYSVAQLQRFEIQTRSLQL